MKMKLTFIIAVLAALAYFGDNGVSAGCSRSVNIKYKIAIRRTVQHISDERTMAGDLAAESTLPQLKDVFRLFNKVLDLKKPIYLKALELVLIVNIMPSLCDVLKLFSAAADIISPIVVAVFNIIHSAIKIVIQIKKTLMPGFPVPGITIITTVVNLLANALDELRKAIQGVVDIIPDFSQLDGKPPGVTVVVKKGWRVKRIRVKVKVLNRQGRAQVRVIWVKRVVWRKDCRWRPCRWVKRTKWVKRKIYRKRWIIRRRIYADPAEQQKIVKQFKHVNSCYRGVTTKLTNIKGMAAQIPEQVAVEQGRTMMTGGMSRMSAMARAGMSGGGSTTNVGVNEGRSQTGLGGLGGLGSIIG